MNIFVFLLGSEGIILNNNYEGVLTDQYIHHNNMNMVCSFQINRFSEFGPS